MYVYKYNEGKTKVERKKEGKKEMYAEAGLPFSYFQTFSHEIQHFQDFCRIKTNVRSNVLQTFTVAEYDPGEEGDLFKAPESIIEEPEFGLDSMAAAISMISGGENVISAQAIKVTDIESIQNDHLLNEVFYGCKNELLEKSALEEPLSEILDAMIPTQMEDFSAEQDQLILEGAMLKSVCAGCLTSMEWISGGAMRPNFIDFHGMDLGIDLGMRRAFSEGDIQNLCNGDTTLVHSPFERLLAIGNDTIEERRQRLSRYRKKKTERNFGRKIKYACRKALADTQPRVRGRFARTEEADFSNSSKQNVNT
ncbi:uncharacterized protein LOC143846232 [Tasmannia lanceolata]|uniref:uncharacterized protein LOC143846232 n=1 Tax=Tasmannia lanceolata TaxID=3420 RepID=UPI0040644986